MPDRESREFDNAYPWLRSNFDHANVIKLDWADVKHLSESGLLDKVNEVNDSMFGHHEDGWVFDPDVLRALIQWMEHRKSELGKLETRILYLLVKALEENSYVYFAL